MQAPVTLTRHDPLPDSIIQRNANSDLRDDRDGRPRTCKHKPELHLTNVFDPKERRFFTSNFQPQESEFVCPRDQVSADKYAQSSRLHSSQGLASKNRFVKCLLSSSDSQSPPVLSTFGIQRNPSPNDLPSLWPRMRSKGICIPYQLGGTDPQGSRNASHCLFGRFSASKPGSVRPGEPGPTGFDNSSTTRVAGEPQKVNFDPSNANRIPGNNVELTYQSKTSSHKKAIKPPPKIEHFNHSKDCQLKRDTKYSRISEFCKLCHSSRAPQSSSSPKTFSNPITLGSQPPLSDPKTSIGRACMVAQQFNKEFRCASSTGNTLPGNGRLRTSMGSAVGQPQNGWPMVTRGVEPPLEPKRDDGRPICLKRSLSCPSRVFIDDPDRQHFGGVLSETRGGNEISSPNGLDLQNLSSPRPLPHTYRDSSFTRPLQLRSRQTLPINSHSGMAPIARDHMCDICKMGCTGNRLICLREQSCSRQLRDPGHKRPRSPSPRCFQPKVALQAGMAVSSPIPNSSGTSSPQLRDGNLSNSGPTLAEGLLEARSQKPSNGSPIRNSPPRSGTNRCVNQSASPRHTQYDPRSLEVWGWTESLSLWSQEQKDFLKSSWRESSLKTYRPAWHRWCIWSQENSVSTTRPSGSDLSRFLIDLSLKHGLSYGTILVYKSAIATLCDPSLERNLSSDNLVKRTLKAISLQKPRLVKPPIWDIDNLLQWLQNNNHDENRLYECSQRAAALLLLCSGRRVHDLTLLDISPENCIVSENSIIFWPRYGSKTDSNSNIQSGWRLLKNTENRALDPTFWVLKVISLSNSRRERCNNSSLFLTTCGIPRPATRAIIANWIKKILLQAGIQASAGSIRPAVASKSWVQNNNIEDILARGNWRSGNTFRKYYCREVRQSTSQHNVSKFFAPIRD